MLLVTFDSNVWRPVSNPSRFPHDNMHEAYRQINAAIQAGHIEGRLSETVFTLEAIRRKDRKTFFANYRPKIEFEEFEQSDGTIQIRFKIGPDSAAHPGNNPYLSSHLADALGIGFCLMKCPRVAGVVNPDLKPEWFVSSSIKHDWADKFGEVGRRLESLGAGRAAITSICRKFASPGEHWTLGLAKAPSSEDDRIASAVSEWADGDTVSAHVAYANHYLCTRDLAAASESGSVFSPRHRSWLEKDYGVRFVPPDELIQHV